MDPKNNQKPAGPPRQRVQPTLDLRNNNKVAQPSPTQRSSRPPQTRVNRPAPLLQVKSNPKPQPQPVTRPQPEGPAPKSQPTSQPQSTPNSQKNKPKKVPRTKNNKKVILTCLAILVALSLLIIGYFLFGFISQRIEKNSTTSNLETNSSQIQIVDNTCYSTQIAKSLSLTQRSCSIVASSENHKDLEVRVSALSEKVSAREGIKQISIPPAGQQHSFKIISEQDTTVDGYPAVKQIYTNDSSGVQKVSVITESPHYEISGYPTQLFLIDGLNYSSEWSKKHFDSMLTNWKWKK